METERKEKKAKKTASIIYNLGFELIVKKAIEIIILIFNSEYFLK